jgi:molecular chaperone HscB
MSEMLLDTSSPLTRDDFSLFALNRQFDLDVKDLEQRWKAIQKQVHPDKFSMAGASAQRLAMQWSSRINEAYRRLKNPLSRATYLCELLGAPIQAESNTSMPADFLIEQMELRENLDEAQSAKDFERLESLVQASIAQRQANCAKWLDEESPPRALEASGEVRAWMFMDRFLQDVKRRAAPLNEGEPTSFT